MNLVSYSSTISIYIQVFLVCFKHISFPGVSAKATAPSNLGETYVTVPGSFPVNKKYISNERRILHCSNSHALFGFYVSLLHIAQAFA